MLAIPVRWNGEVIGVADPRVGAYVRTPAGRARAGVRRDLQPLRTDDRRGRVPVCHGRPGARGGAPRRRRRDAPRPAGSGGLHVPQRGVRAPPSGCARQHRGHASRRARSRRGSRPARVCPSGPGHGRARAGARDHRAAPLHPVVGPGRGLRRGGAAARHLRATAPGSVAPFEGRHDPRDPPSSEEQPADDLLAAAPQGRRLESPEAKAAIEESVRRVRSIALVHEILCARRARMCPSSRSSGPCAEWSRRPSTRRTARCGAWWRATPGTCRRRWRRRWPSCSTSCSRTRSITRFRRARRSTPATVVPAPSAAERSTHGAGGRRRRRAARRVRPRDVDRPRTVDRADARHLRARRARSNCARGRETADRPGTVVELKVAARRGRAMTGRETGSGSAALAGNPCPTQLAALFLGGTAPDAGVLVGHECELETCGLRRGTRDTRPWPGRSARSPGPWCRPGRRGRGWCHGMPRHRASRRSRLR